MGASSVADLGGAVEEDKLTTIVGSMPIAAARTGSGGVNGFQMSAELSFAAPHVLSRVKGKALKPLMVQRMQGLCWMFCWGSRSASQVLHNILYWLDSHVYGREVDIIDGWGCLIVPLQLVHVLEKKLERGWNLDVVGFSPRNSMYLSLKPDLSLVGEAPDVGVEGLSLVDTCEGGG